MASSKKTITASDSNAANWNSVASAALPGYAVSVADSVTTWNDAALGEAESTGKTINASDSVNNWQDAPLTSFMDYFLGISGENLNNWADEPAARKSHLLSCADSTEFFDGVSYFMEIPPPPAECVITATIHCAIS